MSSETFLVPHDWTGRQTYKHAAPRWIKTYANRIFDDGYRNLTAIQRAALHGLELIYAISGTSVPLDVAQLNSKLGLGTKLATWEALNDAGFVDFVNAAGELQSRADQSR